MNQLIVIKNQKEFDNLPEMFVRYTEITIDATDIIHEIRTIPRNSAITLAGKTVVEYLYSTVNVMRESSKVNMMMDNSQVNMMRDNAQIGVMFESSNVGEMWESSRIKAMKENSQVKVMRRYSQVKEMYNNSQIGIMKGSSQVGAMKSNSKIREMWDKSHVKEMKNNAQIDIMRGSSQVDIMKGNSQVKEMWECAQVGVMRESSKVNMMMGNSQIIEMRENSLVNEMRECSQVDVAFENASLKSYSSHAEVLRLKHQSTLICQDCTVDVKEKDDTANIIVTKTMQHTKNTFLEIYRDNMIDDNHIMLYKSVNPDDNFDFYSGKIKYEGIVECPDWDDDMWIECGRGLHLSPTPELALYYNRGKVLKCKVNIKDFVVYPHNINKVRCKRVEVLGE